MLLLDYRASIEQQNKLPLYAWYYAIKGILSCGSYPLRSDYEILPQLNGGDTDLDVAIDISL